MPAEFCENRTKYRLDGALRQLLERKPLDQIRIRELTELCGIRRQSFYYHFPDVYALFQWSLQQEGDRLLERQGSFLTWQQVMEDLLEYTAENRGYYRAVLANQGRAGLRQVLKAPLEGLLKAIRDYYRSRCGVLPELEEQTRWECEETMLFTMMESWVQQDLKQSPKELTAMLETTVRQGVMGAAVQNLPKWGE